MAGDYKDNYPLAPATTRVTAERGGCGRSRPVRQCPMPFATPVQNLPIILDRGRGAAMLLRNPFASLKSTDRAAREEILHRAYAIWESEGHPHDRKLANWLEAEAALRTDLPWRWPTLALTLLFIPTLLWRRTHPLVVVTLGFGSSLVLSVAQLVVVGPGDTALAEVARGWGGPSRVLAIVTDEQASTFAGAGFDLFAARTSRAGVDTAYLCEHFVCDLPLTDAHALADRLGS